MPPVDQSDSLIPRNYVLAISPDSHNVSALLALGVAACVCNEI